MLFLQCLVQFLKKALNLDKNFACLSQKKGEIFRIFKRNLDISMNISPIFYSEMNINIVQYSHNQALQHHVIVSILF